MINIKSKTNGHSDGVPSQMSNLTGGRVPGAPHFPLGEMLIESGAASRDVVRNALKRQRRDRRRLGELLRDMGVESEAVTRAVGVQLGLPTADLTLVGRNDEVAELFTDAFSREHRVLPLYVDQNSVLHVAAANPGDEPLRRQIVEMVGRQVTMELADPVALHRAIDQRYTVMAKVDEAVQRAVESSVMTPTTIELAREVSADAPVVQIVNLIITQGLRDRASDIHIEPQADRLRIRYRVDGALRDVQSLPLRLDGPIASRLKILADMDIVDRHRSQDGQLTMTIDNRMVDVRISTMETVWGEKVVLRLLDRSRSVLPLGQLGLGDEEHKRLQRLINSPYGLFLVSGPTGAGKTTTLYAALNELDRKTRNITTIEDPVEYQFADINQMQINRLAGMTFANGLRSILRQDPDVILVGEIRDVETAQIAVQSALTGHLVLASLHAADSVGALHRFLDMGLEGYLVASAVIGVVAQRLVRLNCPHCSGPEEIRPEEAAFYHVVRGKAPGRAQSAGTGCRECNGTGFYDRRGVFECMTVDEPIRDLLVARATQSQLRDYAHTHGMRSLQDAACDVVDEGQTTIAEAMRTVYVL